MNLKLIITDALQFFRHHITQIATLCLPWLLAIALVEYLVIVMDDPSQETSPFPLLGLAFHLLIYPIYTAALILLMAGRAQRETPTNRELLSSAIQLWQPLLILKIIVACFIIPAQLFVFQGWILFVIPIIFIAVRLSFAEFCLVLDDIKPLEAIRKSFTVTQPYFFQILFLLAAFAMPLWAMKILKTIYFNKPEIDPLVIILPSAVIDFLTLFLDVLIFRAYMSATQERTGPTA